ncbi:MAG: rhodanese-like domain-containing protein [Rhizobacter sp.]|nr:rhodanese-like domain-containing protein [Rhizobacter sp.]
MQQLAVTQVASFCARHGMAVLLDVREAWEVSLAEIRIDGAQAQHIPMGQIPTRLAEIDAAHPIICICHHGVRSAQVTMFLKHKGFESVYNLSGGIDAWSLAVDASVPRY